ncbi:integrase catalytic domain-containing protein [Vairimorpha necatrix]|uniref:Integrase catalytic domain-containing protein n=1 Tax=Vairimorpha necatrix TaxID=6039 RepID=A0AAX4JG29_9MICR
MTDIFSKFTRIWFKEKFRSVEVIECINTWIRECGKPKTPISDNGPQYLIPPYFPQSNGILERINKTIVEVLRMNKGTKMSDIVRKIEHRINNNINTSLEFHLEKLYGEITSMM